MFMWTIEKGQAALINSREGLHLDVMQSTSSKLFLKCAPPY